MHIVLALLGGLIPDEDDRNRQDSGSAIQRAVDAPDPMIEPNASEYLVACTLRMRLGKTLRVVPGAVVRWSEGAGCTADDSLLTNGNHDGEGDRDITIEDIKDGTRLTGALKPYPGPFRNASLITEG